MSAMLISNKKMFFITGASRSGTTLLSFVLRNHSQVFGLKELHYFGQFWDACNPEQQLQEGQMQMAAATMFARQRQGILGAKPAQEDMDSAREFIATLPSEDRNAAGLFAGVVQKLTGEGGKSIPCEQTPRNIFYAEALLKAYPNAHVIHMMRDPRAVMASQKQRWKRRQLATDKSGVPLSQSLRVWVNYHPYTVARLWKRASRLAQRLIDHPRFTLLRFEDLLGQSEPTIRSLCESLGIEFEPPMLEVGQINSSHQSSVGGARKGLHTDAIDKWKSTLSTAEIAITERICGSLVEDFGYSKGSQRATGGLGELRYRLSFPLHLAGVMAVNPHRAWIQLQAALKSSGSGKEDGHMDKVDPEEKTPVIHRKSTGRRKGGYT